MRAPEILLACAAVACVPAHAETFDELVQRCAPDIHPQTLRKLATVESSGNPFAISNWPGKQPRSQAEALAVIRDMQARGQGFAVGVVQIWHTNVPKYGHTFESILEPCNNVRVGAQILREGFVLSKSADEQLRVREALSRYYSGNATRGFQPDKPGGTSYVQRVVASAGNVPAYVVPAIQPHASDGVAAAPVQAAAQAPSVKAKAKPADDWMVTVGAAAPAQEPAPAKADDWMGTVN